MTPRSTTTRAERTGSQSLTDASGATQARKMTTDTTSHATDALRALSERQFQAKVVAGLQQRGYLVWVVPDMRKTLAGLPDLIFVHPTRVPRRVYFWELKREVGGRISKKQEQALAALGDVYGIDARIVRPSDWSRLKEEV